MFPIHLTVNIVCLDVQCVLWLTTFSLFWFSDFCTCATYHCGVCHIRIVFVLLILLHSRCVFIHYRAICYSIIFVCIACHTIPTTVVCVTEKPFFAQNLSLADLQQRAFNKFKMILKSVQILFASTGLSPYLP